MAIVAYNFELLADRLQAEKLEPGAVGLDACKYALGDLLTFTANFHSHFINVHLPAMGLPSKVVQCITEKCSSVPQLRQYGLPMPNTDNKSDRSWILFQCKPYQKSTEAIVDFLTESILDCGLNGSFKTAVKCHQCPLEVMEYCTVKKLLGELDKVVQQDTKDVAEQEALGKQELDAQQPQEQAPGPASALEPAAEEQAKNAKEATDQDPAKKPKSKAEEIECALEGLRPEFKNCALARFDCTLIVMKHKTKIFWGARAQARCPVILVHLPENISHKERVRRLREHPIISNMDPTQGADGRLMYFLDSKAA